MNVKVVIPARFGSSRLEGKPLLRILNKPMVLHVVDRCLEAGIPISNIFVATDDESIRAELSVSDVRVILTSKVHNSGTDRINEVATKLHWNDSDIVINVQGDEPLIPPRLIWELSVFAVKNPKFDITTAVAPLRSIKDFNNPNVVKAILGSNGRAIYFTRSSAPKNRDDSTDLSLAKRHIGVYSYRVSALKEFCSYGDSELENYEKLEQLRALSHGMSIGAIVYEGNVPHGVDTIEDFENVKKEMEVKL